MSYRMLGALVGATVCVSGPALYAAPIPLNPASGSNGQIAFTDGQTDKGLFGDPILSGTSLLFPQPQNFIADAANNSAETTTDRLSFKVSSTNGQDLKTVKVHEEGDWSILGLSGTVKVTGALYLTDLSPAHFGTLYKATPIVTYQDVENSVNFTSPSRPKTDGSGTWAADFTFTLPTGVKSVQFVLNNNLQAQAGSATAAFVQKKSILVTFSATVPEPASLATLALCGTALLRRRRTV